MHGRCFLAAESARNRNDLAAERLWHCNSNCNMNCIAIPSRRSYKYIYMYIYIYIFVWRYIYARLGGGTPLKSQLQLQYELYRNSFQAVIYIYTYVYIYRYPTLYILTTWRQKDCETTTSLAQWNALWSLPDGHLYICVYITPYTYDLKAERLWNRVCFPFDSRMYFRVVTQKLIHIHIAWYTYIYMYTAQEWRNHTPRATNFSSAGCLVLL